MHLFVVRHGIAEQARADQDDAIRELTSEGERKVQRVVDGLRELGWRFERVLTSPWARAAQTARLLAPIATSKAVASELLCKAPTPELLALIAEDETPHKERATAVVGHEPWLGELIGWLAFGSPTAGHAIEMRKAGVAWLEGSATPGGMKLCALLTPKIARALR